MFLEASVNNFIFWFHGLTLLARRPGRKKSLGRPRHKWENTLKLGGKEIGW
jgi:hypothetical protein